jgi:hypothetical protein
MDKATSRDLVLRKWVGSQMETMKDIAQIIFYVSLSISGPLAVFEFLKLKNKERQAQEHKIYDELDNRFFEYQKLALQYYDLDILDPPNIGASAKLDKKRKQEMVAYAILFSLFERAFLMFHLQTSRFRLKQWSGWKYFLNDIIRREGVRTSWHLTKETYDTDFQLFMDRKIDEMLAQQSLEASLASSPDLAPDPVEAPAGKGGKKPETALSS